MTSSMTADAIVVGGGINGAAISYNLARAGLRVIVLEAVTPGYAASGRGAGIIRSYYRLQAEAQLALLSIDIFRRWADEIGGTCGYIPTGFMWMVGPEGVDELTSNVAAQRRLGADVEILSRRNVVELQPHLSGEGLEAAVYERNGGYGDPVAASASLHLAASRFGADLRENSLVTALTTTSGRVTGTKTTLGRLSAPIVVLAAGAWSARLAASAGVSIPVVATRMTTGTIRHEAFSTSPVTFIDATSDTFYRPRSEPGVAHVSVRDARHNTALDPSADWAGERNDLDAGGAMREAIERLKKRIPLLAAEPLRAWAGLDGVTPDYRAIYGAVPQVEGMFLCVGGNFKGFKVAPGVALCLAELITGGRSNSVDLAPFRLDRFASTVAPAEPPAYALSKVV
jgi:sarcosine oxidase subunit beta